MIKENNINILKKICVCQKFKKKISRTFKQQEEKIDGNKTKNNTVKLQLSHIWLLGSLYQ